MSKLRTRALCRAGLHDWFTDRCLFFEAVRCRDCRTPKKIGDLVQLERERNAWWTAGSWGEESGDFAERAHRVARQLFYEEGVDRQRAEAQRVIDMPHCFDIMMHGNFDGDNFVCFTCGGRVTDIRIDG